jgi:putative tricarboxylic transport membrane protein
MSDRVFGTAMLLLAIGYGVIAWQLKAPFQYDPLGPESWPKILTLVIAACALYLVLRPDAEPDWGRRSTLGKLAVSATALAAYALFFEPLGFMIATVIFVAGLAWYCGARATSAA